MSNIITSIHLCNVPITPTHQIDFDTVEKQYQYFNSKKQFSYEKCRYQARTGTIRVKGYVDKLQKCNYGYYTNSYEGTSKTFYFWIVAKNLVAKETTELTIQIDVFQTWLFDWNLKTCLIERGHVLTDDIKSNTVPEDFELGEYVTASTKKVSELQGDLCYFVGVTDADKGIIGSRFGKLYSGYGLKYYKTNETSLLSNYLQELSLAGKADAVAFIFSFPQKVAEEYLGASAGGGMTYSGVESAFSKLITTSSYKKYFSFNGEKYTPYNKKLLCYPYNFLTVHNPSGSNVVLKYEQFNDPDIVNFKLETVLTQNPKFTLTPTYYNGNDYAIEDSIECQGYGLCSWNNDNYANWYAQNHNSINAQSANARASYNANTAAAQSSYSNSIGNTNLSALGGSLANAVGAVGSAASLLTGNIGGGISGLAGAGVGEINNQINKAIGTNNATTDLSNSNLLNTTNYQNTIRSIMASVKDAQVQPNTCKGDTTACGLDVARNTNTFYIKQTTIKPEYARKIDMYFQMYGYQLNSIDNPTKYLRSRKKWNYVKTLDVPVTGAIPHEDIQAIKEMFDNGLTIWHSETYMYNYDTTNEIR